MGYGAFSISTTPGACMTGPRIIQTQQIRRVQTENSPLLLRGISNSHYIYNWKTCFLMGILIVGIWIGIHLMAIEYSKEDGNFPFRLIYRDFWYKGDLFNNFTALDTQVSNIFLSHTRSNFCYNFSMCLLLITELSKNNSSMFSFNFLIGSDGQTYEIRGWNYESGFSQIPHNNETLAIGLIGDFTFTEPSPYQKYEFKSLIIESLRRKKLSKRFKIHGLQLVEIKEIVDYDNLQFL